MIDQNSKILSALSCLGLLLLLAGPSHAQQTKFPYRATVVSDGAVVRSGPGETHYGTDRLAPGTKIEIYRHDPGGWMAIRPPEGSFCLVQREEVELDENGGAEVLQDDTLAWVGTRLNPVQKPLFQVKLRAGESLQVLGVVDREKFELQEDQPDWVQVEPPKGEFRWIAAKDITAEKTESPEQPVDEPSDPLKIVSGQQTKPLQNSGPRPFESWGPKQTAAVFGGWGQQSQSYTAGSLAVTNSGSNTTVPAASGWKPARKAIANFVDEPSTFIADASFENNNISPNAGFTEPNTLNSGANSRSEIFDANGSNAMIAFPVSQVSVNGSAALLTPTFGNPALQSLEMRLTQEMLKPPAAWNLMPLAAEAEQLRTRVSSQQEMNQLGLLIEKIRKCREIQAGYRATGDGGPVDLQTMRNRGFIAASPMTPAVAPQASGELLYNYDAHGYLNQLVRGGGSGQATYVLQDETGVVTHHVAAPPGVNLRPYLNQRVGIVGNRGFHQQLQLNHVTAERVIALDSLRR
ncbi:MAG: SH3 domain-containing protein [Pirellulaceae bacterium]|nr:SH3 domain-containing protein [Pirellulaceae bacterium]